MRNQKGLSLIELMIAITLGIVLMTGVIQVFLSSRVTFVTQQGISRIQESGRLAMEFVSRDIRMAGYLGCGRRESMLVANTLSAPGSFENRMDVGIEGFTAPVSFSLSPTPLADTDVLVIRSASGNTARVAAASDAQILPVVLTGQESGTCSGGGNRVSGICQNDVLSVSDCVRAQIFQATSVTVSGSQVNIDHDASGNAIPLWGAASMPDPVFLPGAEVITMNRVVYYIAQGTSGLPSLYQNINGQSLELLEGVQDMRLLYGQDTDGDSVPNDYVSAGAIGTSPSAWENVLSVRVQLLIQSPEDNVIAEPQKYTFAGSEETPDDRRLRQVFVNTIGIRSRLP